MGLGRVHTYDKGTAIQDGELGLKFG